MNTLVVYESQFGNTEQLARSIAATWSAFGSAQVVHVDPTHPVALEGVDVLILASPTQAFRQMPTIRAFIENLPREALNHLSVACFDTRVHMPWPLNGAAAPGMARQLRQKGCELIGPPEGFFVKGTSGPLLDGEEERATRWAVSIHEKYVTSHPPIATR